MHLTRNALLLIPVTAALLCSSVHHFVHAADTDTVRQPGGYGARPEVLRFGAELAQRLSLDPDWVQKNLEQARYMPRVSQYIMPPRVGVAKNWAVYRNRFVEPKRIRTGVIFWQAHEKWLKLTQERYGVPPEIVVGIIGVETIYGEQMGNFRVIDALATLAFDFPAGRKDRSAFFRQELESYFVMCRNTALDPLQPTGSFAGAMGMPQFMPSSVNKYAIDMDNDGQIDLRNSPADVIGSVAHYLAEFGWQRGLPTHFDVEAPINTTDRALMLVPDILPSFTVAEFAQQGATLSAAALASNARRAASSDGLGKLALIELQNGDQAPSYVAGTQNFYVVTRYNWSSYYALAVIELGEAVARERARQAE
jgi:membrane-bound lytic murein transglycosylase B